MQYKYYHYHYIHAITHGVIFDFVSVSNKIRRQHILTIPFQKGHLRPLLKNNNHTS